MRIRLKGINSITKRSRTARAGPIGTHGRAGRRRAANRARRSSSPATTKRWRAMVVLPRGKLLGILQQYQASENFTGLAASTRRSYVALIVRIAKAFADFQLEATPSQHQVMRQIDNGSPVQLVRNDTEIVSRIMPEQGQLERLGSIRNCQRSAGSRGVLMIAD